MKIAYLIIIIINLLNLPLSIFAQSNKTIPLDGGFNKLQKGMPLVQVFNPTDYDGHNQNWAIAQDHRGVMYFGNESGVLEYDGISWRIIPLPNHSVVRSLAVDSTGRVYVGGQREFG